MIDNENELKNFKKWDEPLLCVTVRDQVIFKNQNKTINFGRKHAVGVFRKAFNKDIDYIVISYLKVNKININNPRQSDLHEYGTLCFIDKARCEISEDLCAIHLKGLTRVKIATFFHKNSYEISPVLVVKNEIRSRNKKREDVAFSRLLMELKNISKYLRNDENGSVYQKDMASIDIRTPWDVIVLLSKWLDFSYEDQIDLFTKKTLEDAINKAINSIDSYGALRKYDIKIRERHREELARRQREYFLREKIKSYTKELQKYTNSDEQIKEEDYEKRLEKGFYPENVVKRLKSEIKHYRETKNTMDGNITRNYIELMLDLPWWTETNDIVDINYAKKELEKDHYGLQKVKERIIQHLAIMFYKKKKGNNAHQTSIICLVGPPGVGKTSLGESIAKAMGRKFVRMALGGISDEAEIRGHRKTYVGAMPGRIIKAMRRVGVINPVFLLDEVDKLGSSSYKGDPSSALLEVLDPAQNKAFNDNYVEEDYDLSKVFFICTANYEHRIPEPLLDRMEVINLSSYTELEKLHIAKNHLIKKVYEATGIPENKISFSDSGILEIIRKYTREAGVRELQRLLENICRVQLVNLCSNNDIKKVNITKKNVEKFLKKPRYEYQKKDKRKIPGIVNGLAYTQYGGDVLPVEVTHFKGTGKLSLTGRLGEVFQESANISKNYIKSYAKKLKIDSDFFAKFDMHLHCPEGAVPKDGPSAGITITTAILSAIMAKPVSNDLGMTGEITLHGQVLPIGGLKEKVISAHRTGLKTVIFPKGNVKDLDDIPEEVRKDVTLIPVESYLDVMKIAFPEEKVTRSARV